MGSVGSVGSGAGGRDCTLVIIGVELATGGVTVLAVTVLGVIVIPGMFGKVIIPPVGVMVISDGGLGIIVEAGGTTGKSGGS